MLLALALSLPQTPELFDGARGARNLERLGSSTAFVYVQQPDLGFGLYAGALDEGGGTLEQIGGPLPSDFGQAGWAWRGRYVFFPAGTGAAAGPQASTLIPGGAVSILPASDLQDLASILHLDVAGDRLVMFCRLADGSTAFLETHLWTTNEIGAPATRTDFPSASGWDPQPAPLGDRFCFLSVDLSIQETRIVVSDGSQAGTQVLAIVPDVTNQVAAFGDGESFWFSGYDSASGRELWRSDGTSAGTVQVLDLVPGPDGSFPSGIRRVGDRLLFKSQASGVEGVWSLDVNTLALEQLDVLPPGSTPLHVRTLDGTYPDGVSELGFIGSSLVSGGPVLWATDGTAAGTTPIQPSLGPTGIDLSGIGPEVVELASDGTYLLAASAPGFGEELWRTDGTSAGTSMVLDLYPGPESSSPRSITPAGDRVLFNARPGGPAQLVGLSMAQLGVSSAHPLGVTCPDTASLSRSAAPSLGSVAQLDLVDGTPGQIGALLIGRELQPQPAIGTCSLGIVWNNVRAILTLDGAGGASTPSAVPNDPALVGEAVRLQWFEVEPGGPVGGLFGTSNVLELIIGA